MYKWDSIRSAASKHAFLCYAVIFFAIAAIFMVALNLNSRRVPQSADKGQYLDIAFPQTQAEEYLMAAEMYERERKYALAEHHYRRYIEIAQTMYPEANFDGMLGRILDLQGRHSEADAHYANFESFVTRQKVLLNRFTKPGVTAEEILKGRKVVSDGRLLRTLQAMPDSPERSRLPYSKKILSESKMTAAEIGLRASLIRDPSQAQTGSVITSTRTSAANRAARTRRIIAARNARNAAWLAARARAAEKYRIRPVTQSPVIRVASKMPPTAPSPIITHNSFTVDSQPEAKPKKKRFIGVLGKCLKAPVKVAGSLFSAVKRGLD